MKIGRQRTSLYHVTKFFLTNRLLTGLKQNVFHVMIRFINKINFAEFFFCH